MTGAVLATTVKLATVVSVLRPARSVVKAFSVAGPGVAAAGTAIAAGVAAFVACAGQVGNVTGDAEPALKTKATWLMPASDVASTVVEMLVPCTTLPPDAGVVVIVSPGRSVGERTVAVASTLCGVVKVRSLSKRTRARGPAVRVSNVSGPFAVAIGVERVRCALDGKRSSNAETRSSPAAAPGRTR